jgi:UDP-N-acetylmuramate: L-alanyl-gamma-D-glutamyl-meso-diaminopimelate ligase
MHIHILGICGTFMAGIAVLAKQLDHTVTGSDTATYPPMSTQLEALGIECHSGYQANLMPSYNYVVIGNALSRGNPEVEAVLNQGLPYISGPQWLAEQVLTKRWVLAVAGTHGKTTTSSMVAWILEDAGLSPGFLIGGVPENFGVSARLGDGLFFVVEADEYDTAFFDKRSKFVHYHPRTLVLNNLEFDHADIFPNLAAIQQQFHHLIRTVPSNGLIIHKNQQVAIDDVLTQGCWTPRETISETNSHINNTNSNWTAKSLARDNSHFEVWHQNKPEGEVKWALIGQHNVVNALAAIASSRHAGVPIDVACEALGKFQNVKRRLELRGVVNGISVYDDFAHHPTAISVTLEALRQKVEQQRIIAVLEPRSNTMRMGIHKDELASALNSADAVILYQPDNLNWSLFQVAESLRNGRVFNQMEALIEHLVAIAQSGDHILIMSNGGFENIHSRLLTALAL